MDNSFDSLFYDRGDLIGGLDETGVSDIAGPLVAACVILPKVFSPETVDIRLFDIDDSKKIPEKYRAQHSEIIWNCASAIGIGEVSASEIDFVGKRKATILAMARAVSNCQSKTRKAARPSFLLIDGAIELPVTIPQECVKDADAKSLSVAAASIIAKVYRDDVMRKLHDKLPFYGWNKNKGHPCENHFQGIDSHGIQVGVHRTKSWPFVPNGEKRDAEPMWLARRGLWRQKTLEALLFEIGDESWITKQPSSKEFRRSKRPPAVTQSAKDGSPSSKK